LLPNLSFRKILLLFLISCLGISICACNRESNSVSPVASSPPSIAHIFPGLENSKSITINPKISANIAPNPIGVSLLWKYRMTCSTSPGYPQQITNFFDGNPETSSSWSSNYPILIEWPQPVSIDRVFLASSNASASFLLFAINNDNWQQQEFNNNNAFGIDLTLLAPVTTQKLVLIPENSVRISELEIYGPSHGSFEIISPANGTIVSANSPIMLAGAGPTGEVVWYSDIDGEIGNSLNGISSKPLSLGTHTIYLSLPGQINVRPTTGSIRTQTTGNISPAKVTVGVAETEIDGLKIVNVNTGEVVNDITVSYRAAQTQFQAIGYREDGSEIGPVSVRWELEGGEVDVHDQLKMGILSQLGQLNTRIGNLDNSQVSVASSTTVTFNSFLPGNVVIKASRGDVTDSVYVRIKQPHFSVNIYPVGDVDTSIFNTWKDIALQIWEKENIIKVDSINLMPTIANVSYPDYPLTPPLSETEDILFKRFGYLSYSNPLVYDCLLGDHSGFFYVPKQSGLLLEKGEIAPLNVFMVQEPWCYYVSDSLTNPPEKRWRQPVIYSISSRDHFVTLENSSVILQEYPVPYPARYERYLAAGIGRNFGLPQYANWLNNFMDFSDNGAFDVTPLQYIAALNYNNDNPQNSVKIREE
jgi:hypothetical protein